jgi:hypothetical protein
VASSCSGHRGAFSHTTYSGYDPTLQKFWPPKCEKNRILSASNSWPSHHHRHNSSQVFHAIAQEIQLLDLLKLDSHDNDDEFVAPTSTKKYDIEGSDINNKPLHRTIELADSIGVNDNVMVRRYKRAMVESMTLTGFQRERELGLAHYLEVVGDGHTFEGAKEFIADESRPRLVSKL